MTEVSLEMDVTIDVEECGVFANFLSSKNAFLSKKDIDDGESNCSFSVPCRHDAGLAQREKVCLLCIIFSAQG